MTDSSLLTDAYLAELLAKDAKDASLKYSALGLQGYASSTKPPANKPKPNTRFLRNIIESTDNHNAALRAKESADSRARLKDLSGKERKLGEPVSFGAKDIRRRQLGDIKAILGGAATSEHGHRKRKRRAEESEPVKGKRVDSSSGDEMNEEQRSRRRKRHRYDDFESKKDRRVEKENMNGHRTRRREGNSNVEAERPRRKENGRHRSDSLSQERQHDITKRRSRSSRSPDLRMDRHKRHHHCARDSSVNKSASVDPNSSTVLGSAASDSDSDPLDSVIGPLPLAPTPDVRLRGRGASSMLAIGPSGMDARFCSSYDPDSDVSHNMPLDGINGAKPDQDWDLALEALRDREKWMQKGAERLRAAGWGEAEVGRWEKTGFGMNKGDLREREKDESDVKWRKKGERREWDVGKSVTAGVDDSGWPWGIEPEPADMGGIGNAEYGRLKGT